MSLVAYGASDESDTSDVEEAEASKATKPEDPDDGSFADDGKISDEDDYVPTVSATASSSSETTVRLQSTNAPVTLSDLPAPKAVPLTSSPMVGEDELEEEVKPKPSQLADAPKPPPKKNKQPARIVIPALKEEDSDDEEENSRKKKQAAAAASTGKRSGLFALLPPPSNATVKQTNRPLIPYTLTKRPTPSKATPSGKKVSPSTSTPDSSKPASNSDNLPSQKHQSAFNALTGYESDSDEEEGGASAGGDLNFFSLGGEEAGGVAPSSSEVKNVVSDGGEGVVRTSNPSGAGTEETVLQPSSSSSVSSKPSSSSVTVSDSPVSSSTCTAIPTASGDSGDADTAPPRDSDENSDENEVTSTVGVPLIDQDAPLNFSSSVQNRGWSTASLVSPMVPEMYAAPSSSSGVHYWQQQQHYAQDYSTDAVQDMESEPGSSGAGMNDMQQFMEDEQFMRMSGKRKRSQENIQIIDANVDDYVDPGDLMKSMTEEQSYQPHRKKDNMPSTQQRRKKQITYLAFQAKERELELKQTWSQNRMTKNQARSKYGF